MDKTFLVDGCSFPFVLKGDAQVRTETTRDYLLTSADTAIDIPKKVTYTLKKGTKKIETVVRDKYSIYFDEPGNMTLVADVQYGDNCNVSFSKEIRVFPFAIAYIGDTASVKIPRADDDTT